MFIRSPSKIYADSLKDYDHLSKTQKSGWVLTRPHSNALFWKDRLIRTYHVFTKKADALY